MLDGLAAAAGASRLLKLNAAHTGHALSIALVPHAAMRQTRSGELSIGCVSNELKERTSRRFCRENFVVLANLRDGFN
ncbi:MAG: hypothetical protein HZC38_09390 [Chloroflexi bacterium]|nr:hypothetical protein [Chloroflexota bacterium]MBI5080246.1 hypothetical protein [Chloroflexota bacterium]MBI5713619.1 hypothetical protein [Chloroflexota bacterium]